MKLLILPPGGGRVIAVRDGSQASLDAAVATDAWSSLCLAYTAADVFEGDPTPSDADLTVVDRDHAVAPSDLTLADYARAKGYAMEIAGTTLAGMSVRTDRDSQGLISRAVALLDADPTLTGIEYDTGASSVSLGRDHVKAVGIAVGRHVQSAFAKRGAAIRAIAAGTVTDRAGVDAILAG